jgi:hypothetical protein
MPEKVESWIDYQAGYRQAVCDLKPDPWPLVQSTALPDTCTAKQTSNTPLFLMYFVGLIVGALLYKWTGE